MNFSSFSSRDRILTWGVPVMLAAVLVLLAVLQYRWSTEASEAATTRMQASLENSMMNFRLDLARELATLCLEMQGDGAPSKDAKRLAQKLEHWQRTSALPGLVANVYEWNNVVGENSRLLHFVPSLGRVETIPWPTRFERLRELLTTGIPHGALEPQGPHPEPDLDDTLSPGSPSPPASLGADGRGDKLHRAPDISLDTPLIGGIDESIPLLLAPASRNTGTTWLMVELDDRVLREQVFPQLAERYFGDPRESDFEVAVVARGERPQVLYSSEAGFGQKEHTVTDADLNLFGPPTLHGGLAPASSAAPMRGAFGNATSRPISRPGAGSVGVTPLGMAFDGIRFDPIRYSEDEAGWQIVVKHRKGSVAAAVAQLRKRNLKISFGVLLVLAASMALIIFNSHRARRLAMLQMDFVAGVSHELRTPVAAILSISENIDDGVVADEQQLLRYAGLIRNQAKRLHHLVEQVLRFAATQREATPYTIRRLRISDVIDELLENMSNLLMASGFVVERNIDPKLPSVVADFGVLSQCLQNLITNAIKYGGDDQWVGLRAGSEQHGSTGEVWVTVEDRGIGIDADELKHIFEPFYRSPKVAESRVPGTGLGLSLAKNFAEAMGGRLTVVSEAGKCTAFTLHLPAAGEPKRSSVIGSQPAELEG